MMTQKIEIGTTVRMNKAFRATLSSPQERRNESRRRYTVTEIRAVGSTVIVDMIDGRKQPTGCTIGWLEVA